MPQSKIGLGGISRRNVAVAAVAIVVIAVVLLALTSSTGVPATTSTTSVQQATVSQISGCTAISKPGSYYLAGNINHTQVSGACITIAASDVTLNGRGHSITGSGPFSDVQPYSYGILLQGVSNVSVSNVTVSRFSYDVFMNSTNSSALSYSNFTNSTLSGLYMRASYNNSIADTGVHVSQSKQGGIYVASGGGNSFSHDTVSGNAYYGLVLDASGNGFSNDVFSSNPVDLLCNASSAPTGAGTFTGSTCSVNDYCGFASCKANAPFNFSSVSLSPGPVSSCGTIYAAGNYVLSSDISTSAYSGNQALSNGVPCIRILAANVSFSCSGKQIYGSSYGISVGPVPGASISDCVLSNDTYGVYLSASPSPQVSNSLFSNDAYGLFLNGTSAGSVSNDMMLGNDYGLYVNSSPGTLFYGISAHNNSYGVYLNSGYGAVFNRGAAANNTKSDLYCTPATYNSTTDLAQDFSCGVTTCSWASSSCRQTVLPSLSVYPLSSCGTITRPGSYELSQDLLAQGGTCMSIDTSNVVLSCNGHSIRGAGSGSAFIVGRESNVSISNCTASNFAIGIKASNASGLSLRSDAFSGVSAGFSFYNISDSLFSSLNVSGATSYGFNFTRLASSSITHSSAGTGSSSAYGFAFINATLNNIGFDSATSNPGYGFLFDNSRNNTVYNNTADSNKAGDYVCSGSSTGIYSNPISVDSGITKSDCTWLVETSPVVQGTSCTSVFSPSSIVLSRDMFFTNGDTCFGVYVNSVGSANGTSIDCAGHTVYAEKGGTFANIVDAAGVRIYNCLLVNFTTGIEGNGQDASVYNNTIVYAGNAIRLSGRFSSIYRNTIQNGTNGIEVSNTTEADVYNNRLYSNADSLVFSDVSAATVTNNTVQKSAYGAYLSNTTSSTMQSDIFSDSSRASVYCVGTSLNSTSSNIDSGGNACQTASNCGWFSASGTCR